MASSTEKSVLLRGKDRSIPFACWIPPSDASCPLVLVGHGGAGHKRSKIVLDLAHQLGEQGIAVAAIDGPVHGERRSDNASADDIRDEFRALWDAGASVGPMVEDWQLALAHVTDMPEIDVSRLGYYGLSMGTAYGLPFLAQSPGIAVAVIGMWGTSRAHSSILLESARAIDCETMFCIQWDDELFTRNGQFELFDALKTPRKQMNIYPGQHVPPTGNRLIDIVDFLGRQLLRD